MMWNLERERERERERDFKIHGKTNKAYLNGGRTVS
jgi:hypothetical protein